MSIVGNRIKDTREKRGLTQRELATRINKSPSAISAYEAGAQTPPTDVLLSIARALCVSITYLAGSESEDVISTSNLTEPQKELINLIYREFTAPTGNNSELSYQQVEIIRRIISIFA